MKTRKGTVISIVLVLMLMFAGLATAWFSEPRDMLWNGLQTFKQAVTFDGAVTFNSTSGLNGTTTYTLGATENVAIDGNTTAQTQTAGALDINVSSGTANTSAINIALVTATGTAGATDVFAQRISLTQNDADADMFGIQVLAAATTNAAAGSYEYGFGFDCVENTVGGCLDGLRIESSGINGGLTDGIDVSAANITNAINIGVNPILGGNDETFHIGATDAVFLMTRSSAGAVTLTSADDDATADMTIDPGGNAVLTLGSANDTVAVAATSGISTPLASLTTPKVTAGTGTGVTIADAGSLRTQVYKVTVAYNQFDAAAVTHDLVIGTMPAKSIVHSVVANVSTPFVCAAVCTTATLSATLGVAAGGADFLESFDVDNAAAWFGDADAEVGDKLDIAANTNGGFPMMTGGALTLRATSGTGNWGDGAGTTNLNAGVVTFYVLYSILP